MSEPVELEQLGASESAAAPAPGIADLRRLSAVPIELTVEIGRARMTVGETLELHPGAIVTLNRMAGEPVDLLVNGTAIARAEVVVIDEQFGVRITEVIGQHQDVTTTSTPPAPPAPTTDSDEIPSE